MIPYVFAMVVVVVASNILVQYPVNDWITWGAFTYPVSFLVTDLTNRRYGPRQAMVVACVGFAIAVVLSIWLADFRIAVASGAAFLTAQLLDVGIFDRIRHSGWWKAPLISSGIASIIDTALFFSLAFGDWSAVLGATFADTGLPWHTWAVGDLAVKFLMALVLLLPFGWFARSEPAYGAR